MSAIIDPYDTILFDMDGVISSEENYWDAAALTVCETLYAKTYFGDASVDPTVWERGRRECRALVFDGEETIRRVKNVGVNSNWDLAYVALGAALILGKPYDFARVGAYLRSEDGDAFALYRKIGDALAKTLGLPPEETSREGALWQTATMCFQEWYLGDRRFEQTYHTKPKQPGKRGLMNDEEPLVDRARLVETLAGLRAAGKRLGIGTGRPRTELDGPLDRWGVRRFFDPDAIVTYTDVTEAERRLASSGRAATLTKPHPFMFLKGAFGRAADDASLAFGDYDRSRCARALVVGDAGADLYAAHRGGFDFCAVLTGIHGEAARPFFEREGAEYIVGSVLELSDGKLGQKR